MRHRKNYEIKLKSPVKPKRISISKKGLKKLRKYQLNPLNGLGGVMLTRL